MLGTLLTLFSTTLAIMPVSTQAIQPQTEIITDFDGNEFILIEGDNTYEIYTSDNVSSMFKILQMIISDF